MCTSAMGDQEVGARQQELPCRRGGTIYTTGFAGFAEALGKALFAVRGFAEWALPSVTLGKGFAKCKQAFAECYWHSAKSGSPVVIDLVRNYVVKQHTVYPQALLQDSSQSSVTTATVEEA